MRPTIVVVDNASTDETLEIAHELSDVVITAGPERSAQRNAGAGMVPKAEILGFIDSDMVLSSRVVEEVVGSIQHGSALVIVPEVSRGEGFWASVRAYERSFYAGSSHIEAARFYSRPLFEASGGFDESLTGPEDWDLSMRVRRCGQVGRVQAVIYHDEGRLSYLEACRKKGYYAAGLRSYIRKVGSGRAVRLILDRPYVRQPWLLARRPILGAALITLKCGETAAAGWNLSRRRAPTGSDVEGRSAP